jgi:hypothetical protein
MFMSGLVAEEPLADNPVAAPLQTRRRYPNSCSRATTIPVASKRD